ncbi:glycosyltransferase family 2 protein [Salinimicrobium oceani]|uniref:Glycosyltransferase family 2 protein n=1 Tax=Salinimicrobium oceani TaxID=2722702 RepID=A0ABX1D2U7_9FLAO|nr:glycosyltransferase family 2 protein [Salinimicrobium oceani]NJW53657.1 glycosyltransferase family 2 protein [Salinimicrobium oceani]
MQHSKVIILLATHNRAHLIGETLNSILAQTYPNWECLIIDDFSTDNTSEIVNQFLTKDPRFSYYQKPSNYNKGLSASRNYGLSLAKQRPSNYIQFFDDDDLMHPRKLELQISSLYKNPQSKFSICGWSNFKEYREINWNQIGEVKIKRNLTLGESFLIGDIKFVAQVPLFRYDYAIDFKFDEDLFYAEEWALFSMHFLLDKPDFEVVKEVLFYRRKHKASVTEGNDENFIITKTRAIVQIKVFNFLTKRKIHTRKTLSFFTRYFLIYSYDSNKIGIIKNVIRSHHLFNIFDRIRLNTTILFHFYFRKILLKMTNF